MKSIKGGGINGGVKGGGINGGVKGGGVKALMEFLFKNPGKRATEISEIMKTPLRTVERRLKQLKEAKKIKYIGSKKTGGYYIIKQDKK